MGAKNDASSTYLTPLASAIQKEDFSAIKTLFDSGASLRTRFLHTQDVLTGHSQEFPNEHYTTANALLKKSGNEKLQEQVYSYLKNKNRNQVAEMAIIRPLGKSREQAYQII